jgi:hypothetical protein
MCQASSCEKQLEDPQAVMAGLVNAVDSEGRTPLSLASEHGHVECARYTMMVAMCVHMCIFKCYVYVYVCVCACMCLFKALCWYHQMG